MQEALSSLEMISIGATKEVELQVNLYAMMDMWKDIMFPIGRYKETSIEILANYDDIQVFRVDFLLLYLFTADTLHVLLCQILVDDHIIKTLTMKGSAYAKPCQAEVDLWYHKIDQVNRTFQAWANVQTNWLYLLPIFSSKDIVAQMPEEGKLFTRIDGIFRKYMKV